MRVLSAAFLSLFNYKTKQITDNREGFIFYKIVGDAFNECEAYYTIQCINTKAIFRYKISDLVFDLDILHGLHPYQSCYVGIIYGKLSKDNRLISSAKDKQYKLLNKKSISRYGKYTVRFQDRKGNINFIHKQSDKSFLMAPCDIALSKTLLKDFDAAQAFYIGLLSGLKMKSTVSENCGSSLQAVSNLGAETTNGPNPQGAPYYSKLEYHKKTNLSATKHSRLRLVKK